MSDYYPPPPGAHVPETSGKAIAAMVLSIVGLVTCFVLGIVGIILGHSALTDIRASAGQIGGDGMAKAGIIIGWINVGLAVIGVFAMIVIILIGLATS